MITLYWCPQTRAARILWLLEEMDQPFEVRMVDIRDPESKNNPDFIAASPMGKVPAILDSAPGGAVHMADSAAIALYLADNGVKDDSCDTYVVHFLSMAFCLWLLVIRLLIIGCLSPNAKSIAHRA